MVLFVHPSLHNNNCGADGGKGYGKNASVGFDMHCAAVRKRGHVVT